MELVSQDYLEHHGIKGQKWGVRRFQNPDGTLTEAGKKRVARLDAKIDKLYDRRMRKVTKQQEKANRKDLDVSAKLENKYAKTGKLSKRDSAKMAKAMIKNMDAWQKYMSTDIYQSKLRDIRKDEVRSGMNYFEHAMNRNVAVWAFVSQAAGIGATVYDLNKYSPGRKERRAAKQEYKESNASYKQNKKPQKEYNKDVYESFNKGR